MRPALNALQHGFQQHMLGAADATELLRGSAERRALGLAIYANAYRRRLVEALADAYAKTFALLGGEVAEAQALRYIDAHAPSTRSLRWYGADFADHLPQPEAAEMARLDWALRCAFDGADSPLLTADGLAALAPADWAGLRLVPVPTARLLRFEFNTVARWQAIDDEAGPLGSLRSVDAVHWLVWRKALQPHFRSLMSGEAALLRSMLGGAPFAQACEALAEQSDSAAFIGRCLRQWLDDGVLAAVDRSA
jgi:hypothetical protein